MASPQGRSLPAQVVRGVVFAAVLLSLTIAAIVGASKLRPAAHERPAPQPVECPRTTPNDCARLSAQALRIPIAKVPRIAVPAGLAFTSGWFTSIEGITDEWLTFKDQATADTFVLIFHRSGPSDTLRPTNGRIEKVGGWFQQAWAATRVVGISRPSTTVRRSCTSSFEVASPTWCDSMAAASRRSTSETWR
jgi:hypothetical protein